MAAAATHFCCTMVKQYYLSTRFSLAVPPGLLYVSQTRYIKLNFIPCMWCVKCIIA